MIATLLFLNLCIPYTRANKCVQYAQRFLSGNVTPIGKKVIKSSSQISSLQSLADGWTPDVDADPSLNVNLKLLGTILGLAPQAFISDLNSGKLNLYSLNDSINDAVITNIAAGRVVIEKDGLRQELLLGDPEKADSASVIKNILPNVMMVSKSGVIDQMHTANELLQKVKILPVPSNPLNELWGFRIDNIPGDSMLDKAGLEDGDLVYSIQDKKIKSMKDVFQILKEMKGQREIKINLLRNERHITLRYEIVD